MFNDGVPWNEIASDFDDGESDNGENGKTLLVSLDYYHGAFALFHDELNRTGLDTTKPHSIREQFWRLLQEGEYTPVESRSLLKQYLKSVERHLANIISKQSLAYWLHLYRRIFPGPIGEDPRPIVIAEIRATLEAAIHKYSDFSPCNRVGFFPDVPIEKVLGGILLAPELEMDRMSLSNMRQLVLTDFHVTELKEFYEVEQLAYEIWRAGSLLRIIGKGASLIIFNDQKNYVGDLRSDELNELVKIYDGRIGSGYFSAKGVVYSNYTGPKSMEGNVFLPTYNGGSISSDEIKESFLETFDLEFASPIDFNFIWRLFNIQDYRNAHFPYSDAFEEKNGVKLDAVLAVIAGLLYRVMISWISTGGRAITRYWQRAYEGPYLRSFVYSEVIDFLPAARILLGLNENALNNSDIYKAISFWELGSKKQSDIDLAYSGPHYLFLPLETDQVFIDYTWIDRRLYDFFFDIKIPDENFKGKALERVVQFGDSPLPTTRLKALDKQEKQIDASFSIGNRLVIVECKAAGKDIGFDRGKPDSIRNRIELVERILYEVDKKAKWLSEYPKGTNYDIRQFREILPIAVTPFVEYIPSLDSRYWLKDSLPRVLTPAELKKAVEENSLENITKNLVPIS